MDQQALWGSYWAVCGCVWDVLPRTMVRGVVCMRHEGQPDPLEGGTLEM